MESSGSAQLQCSRLLSVLLLSHPMQQQEGALEQLRGREVPVLCSQQQHHSRHQQHQVHMGLQTSSSRCKVWQQQQQEQQLGLRWLPLGPLLMWSTTAQEQTSCL